MDEIEVDVRIRAATGEDAEAIARLWERLVAYHRTIDNDLPDSSPEGGRLYAQRLLSRLQDNQTQVLVADENSQVIGYVLGVIVDLVPEMFIQQDSGFLADIYVDEAYRGYGVGKALVEHLKSWFIERNVQHFEWYVAAHNHAGRAFWNAIGGRDIMIRMRANLDEQG